MISRRPQLGQCVLMREPRTAYSSVVRHTYCPAGFVVIATVVLVDLMRANDYGVEGESRAAPIVAARSCQSCLRVHVGNEFEWNRAKITHALLSTQQTAGSERGTRLGQDVVHIDRDRWLCLFGCDLLIWCSIRRDIKFVGVNPLGSDLSFFSE